MTSTRQADGLRETALEVHHAVLHLYPLLISSIDAGLALICRQRGIPALTIRQGLMLLVVAERAPASLKKLPKPFRRRLHQCPQ